jgi:serine/threonine protein kinase
MFNELLVMNLIQNPRPEAAVKYYEVWRDPEGTVIRMDHHNGTLRRWIKPHHILSDPDWIPIMLGIATRLTAAHAAGFVHMDLKPSNSFSMSCFHIDNISTGESHDRVSFCPGKHTHF